MLHGCNCLLHYTALPEAKAPQTPSSIIKSASDSSGEALTPGFSAAGQGASQGPRRGLFRPCCVVSRGVSSDSKLLATIKDFCSFCVKNELCF